jgi:thiosulfate reductase cytochrome b subunit
MQLWEIRRAGVRYRPSLNVRHPGVRRALRLLDDQLVYKPSLRSDASATITGWHADRAYWATCSSDKLCTAWIPFHDVDVTRGPLVVMAGSGLRILVAYPFLGPQGGEYAWYPLQGTAPPGFLTVGGWLAGARHWHFAFGWLFVANAAAYLAYLFASGEWRRRLFFPRRDARSAWGTLLHDLHLRKEAPPPVGLYNGMQRLAYTGVLAMTPLLVLSGLAMYKPVQLPRLTALLGGYDVARVIHLGVLVALALFTIVHVVEVLRHPRTLADMTVGREGRPEEAS